MMKLRFLGFALTLSTFGALATGSGVAFAAPMEATGRLEAEAPPARPEPARRTGYDEPPTLAGPRGMQLGGYGSIGAAYTHMLGRDGALMSLEGALLVGHRLSLGLAGYGFSQTPAGPPAPDGTPRNFGVGYGGFVARYSVLSNFPVYGTLGFLIGGGALALGDDIGRDPHGDGHLHRVSLDGFFVFQPEIAIQTNVTRWFRVSVTGGYRLTSNVDRFGLQSSDLNGFLVGGNLQFGWF